LCETLSPSTERLDRAMMDGWHAVLAPIKRASWSPGWRRAQRGLHELWTWLRPMVDTRRRQGGRDLLSRMCRAHDDAHWLDDDDTRIRMFISIMFAAFDTTAAAVTSMAYLLAKHPAWQERLREEALAVNTRRLDPGTLKSLPELEWAWKETLRIYPVAGQVVRQSLRETELCGHRIPPVTSLWTMPGTLANDPRWWTSPERFDPERFSPARAEAKRHKAIFLPFGAGPHPCIGAQLSIAEIKAFWHALLTRARIRLIATNAVHHTYAPIGMVSGNVDLVIEPL
jgi:cytochrome P450